MADDAPAIDPALTRAKQLIDKLWSDGKVGKDVRAHAKEMFPDITLPDDQIEPTLAPLRAEAEEMRNELKAIREERAAEVKARDEARTQQNLEAALTAAGSKYHLTGDGFDKMVAHMKETGNYTDAEGAAAWVAQQTPPPQAPGPSWAPQDLNLFGTSERDEKLALLHRDPVKYQDAEIMEMLRDPDKYVRDTFAA